jgi:hypothetical protein
VPSPDIAACIASSDSNVKCTTATYGPFTPLSIDALSRPHAFSAIGTCVLA